MSVADANHVRDTGNLPSGIGDEVIAPHLRTAGRRLTRWVGATVYAEAQTEAAGLGDPRVFSGATAQTAALADAEAYLTLALGITSFNIVMTSSGDENAGGIQAEGVIGDSTFRYRNQSDLEKMQESFLRQAEQAAQDYIQDDGGGGSPLGISFALDDDGAEIDADWPE